MSHALAHRLDRLEAAAIARQAAEPRPVFVPTAKPGTEEALAEQAAWQAIHPGPAVICRVFDGRKPSEEKP